MLLYSIGNPGNHGYPGKDGLVIKGDRGPDGFPGKPGSDGMRGDKGKNIGWNATAYNDFKKIFFYDF